MGVRHVYASSPKQHVWNHLIIIALLSLPAIARAQDDKTSTPAAQQDSAANPHNVQQNTTGTGATKDPDISWKHLPKRILEDQKDLWLFPTQLARGRHWVPTLAITGATGVLIATDPHDQPWFRNNPSFEETSEIFSTSNTAIFEFGVPAVVYVTGLLRHDSYTTQTAILTAEAYLDSAIPHVVLKDISRRLRPSEVAPTHDFRDTFFQAHVTAFGKGSSFPSGHAAAAFSIATVMARRYGKHKWVPWISYGLAGLISVSRVPDMAHFPSDVFVGAALGYTITRFDVFRERSR
ncbi:MAG TPA: phosphatase PAP2 family protein [Candidatus Acidoferrales bacterium]|nr:phosphatase PAP2 family protein [Candidatus Acidoferrales bacterium]